MRFSLASIAVSALALASSASAVISGFQAPTYPIKGGEVFNVTFTTRGSLTNNEQYYAIFGLTSGKVYANTIGSQPFANVDIADINKLHNFTVPVKLKDIYADDATKQTLATAVFGQVGASGGTTVQYFNASITVVPS